ncbi:MAG: NAD-dependent epimerase/dehydratase family protein [Flavobacteriales bacterium]|nr:NAD-dependent epimerase/dehydratase family protein [Flavobacteriales bacterium]
MGKTILITGGAGFVGSSLALHLKAESPQDRVISFDNLRRRGSELNIPRLKANGIEFIHGDVRSAADVGGLPPFDLLIECSAEPSVMAGYGADARYVVDTNLMGTVNCLEAAAQYKADVLFMSTSRVYPIAAINELCVESEKGFTLREGATPGATKMGIAEDFPLAGIRSLYGATKLASELLIAEYAEIHGLRAVVNRCGVIAGPWQMGKTDQGFVLLWIARHHWELPLSYIGFGGKGSQVRDVLHIDDLCELIGTQVGAMEELQGKTFNVGGGAANSASLRGFTELSASITGNRITVASDPAERPGDLKLYVTDNSRVSEATGWAPRRNLPTLVADSYQWLLDNEDLLRPILS